jgi:hypothetical protein
MEIMTRGFKISDFLKEVAQNEIEVEYNGKILSSEGNDEVVSLEALDSENWRCIDGRFKEGGKFAFPGGSLGLFAVLYATFKDFVSLKSIKNVFENTMGQITYHTDDHNDKNECACGGCGYANLIKDNREEFFLPEDMNILKELGFYNRELQSDIDEGLCTKLSGGHNEEAVIIFDREDKVELPAGIHRGQSAFVCHSAVAFKTLKILAEDIMGTIADLDEHSKSEIIDNLKLICNTHINRTLHHLRAILKRELPEHTIK